MADVTSSAKNWRLVLLTWGTTFTSILFFLGLLHVRSPYRAQIRRVSCRHCALYELNLLTYLREDMSKTVMWYIGMAR